MINNGCNVIVIAAVDGDSLNQTIVKAAESGVTVIAYERLISGADYYVNFVRYKVGELQGIYVRDRLGLDTSSGSYYVEFTAGDPDNGNAELYYDGAMDILKPYINSGKIIVKSKQTTFSDVSTSEWDYMTAQKRAEKIISEYYSDGTLIDAWVCSNDSTALGVTYALEANYKGPWPIITGQDCDIINVKNILAGKQTMSVILDTRIAVNQIVKMVGQIIKGESVDTTDYTATYNFSNVNHSFLCTPVYCDANNYMDLLIDSGYYTLDDLR
jgi:putative multiple sugar transport system substrate-binding protein